MTSPLFGPSPPAAPSVQLRAHAAWRRMAHRLHSLARRLGLDTRLTVQFGDKAEWWALIRERLDPERFAASGGDLGLADLAAAQIIAPLTVGDIRFLHARPARQRRRALIPPLETLALCEDKLAFHLRLEALGYGAHQPALLDRDEISRRRDDPTLYPFVVKKRFGEWGLESATVLDAEDLERRAGWIADDAYFCQSYIGGALDFTSHIVMHRGEPVYFSTFPFRLEVFPCLRGRLGHATRQAIDYDRAHAPFFAEILRAIGFEHGICCFDYKLVDGRPVIFELNPRFGASLIYDAANFLEAYVAALRARRGRRARW